MVDMEFILTCTDMNTELCTMSINSEDIQTVPWLMQVLASLRGQSVWDLRWTKFPLFMNLFLFCLQVYLNTKDSGRGGVLYRHFQLPRSYNGVDRGTRNE
jgi:hypothetical protein